MGAATCRRQKCHAHIWLPSCPSGLPGSSGAPASGLGESVFAGARVGLGATGPLALFSVSDKTIEVLQSLRERLQSALLREGGAEPQSVGGFFIFGSRRRCGGAGPEQGGRQLLQCRAFLEGWWSGEMNGMSCCRIRGQGWGAGSTSIHKVGREATRSFEPEPC